MPLSKKDAIPMADRGLVFLTVFEVLEENYSPAIP